jgi:hypothetical protein
MNAKILLTEEQARVTLLHEEFPASEAWDAACKAAQMVVDLEDSIDDIAGDEEVPFKCILQLLGHHATASLVVAKLRVEAREQISVGMPQLVEDFNKFLSPEK